MKVDARLHAKIEGTDGKLHTLVRVATRKGVNLDGGELRDRVKDLLAKIRGTEAPINLEPTNLVD